MPAGCPAVDGSAIDRLEWPRNLLLRPPDSDVAQPQAACCLISKIESAAVVVYDGSRSIVRPRNYAVVLPDARGLNDMSTCRNTDGLEQPVSQELDIKSMS